MPPIVDSISLTILFSIRIGPATTFLELAMLADNKGIVVDIGTGDNNCFMLRSSTSSCISNTNSILTEFKPAILNRNGILTINRYRFGILF
jgi:hypothetical protein